LLVYTDGSGINNKIGAAAIAPQIGTLRKAFIGEASTSTVYTAELKGIYIALEIT
jgi:ribonuclease HI